MGLSDIICHHKVDGECYRRSRRLRYGVIYSMLERGWGRSVGVSELEENKLWTVKEFLNERGAEIPWTYHGLDYFRLQKLYSIIGQLDYFRDYYKGSLGLRFDNRVLSASYLERDGLIFWDVYGADKYMKR